MQHPGDAASARLLALTMFDTAEVEGARMNPFDDACALRANAVLAFPPELFFVLRAVQMLRGLAHGVGAPNFSVADAWAPAARRLIAADARARRGRGRARADVAPGS